MRAEGLGFEDVFAKDVNSGKISLGSDRYIMFDADAIGRMRRELIENLGSEVARGVLERVGYQSGRNDAHQLRERFSWLHEEEWLRAGPRLHFLEGIVRVEVEKLDIDREAGRFHMTGMWLDSYEAEQHLRFYGPGHQCVCWTLEGYATGYASVFFGQEVVCFETACRGRGDEVCRFELRQASGWGSAAQPMQEMLAAVRFTERFDRCLRSISEMGCELEQSSLDAIFTTDPRGVITSCSEGGSDLLGLMPGEAIGQPVSAFYAGGTSEARFIFDRLKREGRLRNYLTEVITRSGRRTPIALSASAIRTDRGDLVGTIGIAHNLSEIRRLEDELATKNRFMANILQDSADAIITLDPGNRITGWNRGAEAIFGWSAGEVVGKSISIVFPPESREEQELSAISDRVRKQGAVRSYQAERITKDGRRIQVIFTRTLIRDDSGKEAGSSVVLKDVTTIRNLERQLGDAEHLATLGELSAGLAHEIKNPLAGIKGAIDVIRDSLPASDVHREVLGDVLHEVNRIDKTVKDLLNYAKPKPPSHTTIDLPELVRRIVTMARQSPKSESRVICVEELSETPKFTGDESQFEQVVMNLLLNAQNAVPDGGLITVRLACDREDWSVRLEVEDNGCGIREDMRRKIFQPFFTTRTNGTGLGLATCLKNVQYHGGTIDVASEVGRGTKFTVKIPLVSRI
jgi:PAS domain S-box-containing protein